MTSDTPLYQAEALRQLARRDQRDLRPEDRKTQRPEQRWVRGRCTMEIQSPEISRGWERQEGQSPSTRLLGKLVGFLCSKSGRGQRMRPLFIFFPAPQFCACHKCTLSLFYGYSKPAPLLRSGLHPLLFHPFADLSHSYSFPWLMLLTIYATHLGLNLMVLLCSVLFLKLFQY